MTTRRRFYLVNGKSGSEERSRAFRGPIEPEHLTKNFGNDFIITLIAEIDAPSFRALVKFYARRKP